MGNKQEYKPRPFTRDEIKYAIKLMREPLDNKRTLCNVLKQAFKAAQEESYNLQACQSLLLEALWMGRRMHDKLYKNKIEELKMEQVEDDSEEFTFSVDWSKFDYLPARGNWD